MLLQAIIFGAFMLVLCVLIHSGGTAALVRYFRYESRFAKRIFGDFTGILALSCIAVFLLCLHILQVLLWAGVYWGLINSPAITSFADAFYFSIITYTTVGYGDIVIAGEGRLLSGIESMIGILMFGWSTAILFMAVQKIWFDQSSS
ncbi:potassium channel family protein [Parendozoicomonas haliclonae]|uniref:Voltage-gated potassium channel n=1 Tax=Parendozoicomonas haliclonae TaxID=1960125 RepID=A0A1X7AIQ4_9GAMM|nr:potassium channel family protein [Parendozoicomonas haliclonae]SMA45620.1 voltage-gated potassium channel [Parendozoicomonas haliclonae]